MSDHGSASKYTNDKCRCQPCRDAWAQYIRNRKAQRAVYVEQNGLPAEVEHGTTAYHNWSCRCAICTKSERNRKRALAARRRIQ